MRSICLAINHLHNMNIVHRDIKVRMLCGREWHADTKNTCNQMDITAGYTELNAE